MTITEFLLARIAEDEAGARGAGTYSPQWSVGDEFNETVLLAPDDELGHTFDSAYGQIAPHVAKWDPARVLAECEAKRRIVEHCEPDALAASPGDEYVLQLLASVYADHPDFDPAWRI